MLKNFVLGLVFLVSSQALAVTVDHYSRLGADVFKTHHRYHAYEVEFPQYQSFFGSELKKWCEQYEKAKKIFAPNLEGKLARELIHSVHRHVYGSRPEILTLDTGEKLIAFLENVPGLENSKKHFTYVLLPKGIFRFSRTDESFLLDAYSKHAVHTDAAEEVVYAGEFYVQTLEDKKVLVIDNNSGTYRPHRRGLENLKALLEKNFPGLPVVTHGYGPLN